MAGDEGIGMIAAAGRDECDGRRGPPTYRRPWFRRMRRTAGDGRRRPGMTQLSRVSRVGLVLTPLQSRSRSSN